MLPPEEVACFCDVWWKLSASLTLEASVCGVRCTVFGEMCLAHFGDFVLPSHSLEEDGLHSHYVSCPHHSDVQFWRLRAQLLCHLSVCVISDIIL